MIILFILIGICLAGISIGLYYAFKHVDAINIKFSNSQNNKTYNILSKSSLNTGQNLIEYIYSFKDSNCSFKTDEKLGFIPSKIEILHNNTLFKIKIYFYGYTDNLSNCLQKYILLPEENYSNITNFLENNQFNYLGLIITLEK